MLLLRLSAVSRMWRDAVDSVQHNWRHLVRSISWLQPDKLPRVWYTRRTVLGHHPRSWRMHYGRLQRAWADAMHCVDPLKELTPDVDRLRSGLLSCLGDNDFGEG